MHPSPCKRRKKHDIGLLGLVTRTVNGKIEYQCHRPQTSHPVRRREVTSSRSLTLPTAVVKNYRSSTPGPSPPTNFISAMRTSHDNKPFKCRKATSETTRYRPTCSNTICCGSNCIHCTWLRCLKQINMVPRTPATGS